VGPELEKAEREVERYRAFLRLSQELTEVNDRICQLRPARTIEDEDELEQLKKKLRRHFAEKRKRK
jgi:IS5 family transposase